MRNSLRLPLVLSAQKIQLQHRGMLKCQDEWWQPTAQLAPKTAQAGQNRHAEPPDVARCKQHLTAAVLLPMPMQLLTVKLSGSTSNALSAGTLLTAPRAPSSRPNTNATRQEVTSPCTKPLRTIAQGSAAGSSRPQSQFKWRFAVGCTLNFTLCTVHTAASGSIAEQGTRHCAAG
jgi:hypothetical protein